MFKIAEGLYEIDHSTKGRAQKTHEFSNCLSESQVDEGDELLNCEGEEIQLVEQNQELDKISDEDPIPVEPVVPPTENNSDADMDVEQPNQSQSMIQLAPLCENVS